MKREYLSTKKIGFKLWFVTEPYDVVPAGFITDGASVPKAFHSILTPMSGPHAEAAVIHDYYYSKDCVHPVTRKTADKIFLYTMLDNGTRRHRAYLAYSAVRLFGWLSYQKKFSIEKAENEYKPKTK